MPLYGEIDLHANNNVIVLFNEQDEVIDRKRLSNDLPTIRLLATFGETGGFGGLRLFSSLSEGKENRDFTKGKFLYFPRWGSQILHFTKCGQEPNGIKFSPKWSQNREVAEL